MSEHDKRPMPYLAAALFCEKVMVEVDGVASLHRVVDIVNLQRITIEDGSPIPTSIIRPHQAGASISGMQVMSPLSGLVIYIALKSGEYEGTGEVELRAHKPDGTELKSKQPTKVTVELKGGAMGANVAINIGMIFDVSGVYWFDVFFNGEPLTRMPLTVSVSEQTIGSPAAPDGPAPHVPPPKA